MNALISIPFHNQTVYAVEHDGKPYVAMRPIVENLGLDWKSQHVKLTERFSKGVVKLTTPSAGGPQETICLLLIKLPSFLHTISLNKVKPELRKLVASYQDECDEVLFNHFIGRYRAEHVQLTAVTEALFKKHPQWRETYDLLNYGFSNAEVADLQGKNIRNAQRMVVRMLEAGLVITANKRRMRQAGLLN